MWKFRAETIRLYSYVQSKGLEKAQVIKPNFGIKLPPISLDIFNKLIGKIGLKEIIWTNLFKLPR